MRLGGLESETIHNSFVYHCVLLAVCPFEVVDAVPFVAESLAEAGVICRPPATLVYAGSTQCQCILHTTREALFISGCRCVSP